MRQGHPGGDSGLRHPLVENESDKVGGRNHRVHVEIVERMHKKSTSTNASTGGGGRRTHSTHQEFQPVLRQVRHSTHVIEALERNVKGRLLNEKGIDRLFAYNVPAHGLP